MSSITSGGGGASDIDSVLKIGNTSVEHAEIDGGNTTLNAVTEDRTIAAGDSHSHGCIDIATGRTWTVAGSLYSFEKITVSGTGVLIVTGTAIAII